MPHRFLTLSAVAVGAVGLIMGQWLICPRVLCRRLVRFRIASSVLAPSIHSIWTHQQDANRGISSLTPCASSTMLNH